MEQAQSNKGTIDKWLTGVRLVSSPHPTGPNRPSKFRSRYGPSQTSFARKRLAVQTKETWQPLFRPRILRQRVSCRVDEAVPKEAPSKLLRALFQELRPEGSRKFSGGAVAKLVGIEGGVVSGVFNLESSDVSASDWRPRHDEHYHEACFLAA